MELVDYFRLLRRRWLLILAAVAVCAGASVYFTSQQTRVYQSTVQFVLTDDQGQPVDSLLANAAQQRVPTYSRLAGSQTVIANVLGSLSAEGLTPRILGISTNGDAGTVFMNLTVRSDSPQGAFALAVAFGNALPPVIADFEQSTDGVNGLSVFQSPGTPRDPISPDPARNYTVGFMLGLVLGIAAALVAEALDRRLHSPEEAEKVSGLDLLSAVPIEHRDQPLVTVTQPRSRRAEAIRQVRTNVQFAAVASPLDAIVVTSAVAGEGKTSIATNLAVASALAGQRVIIVDADLRRPMVSSSFGLEGAIGLADVLIGNVELEDALQPWGELGENLRILPSGTRPANPSELLASGAMIQLTERLRTVADLIIFDTPPVLPVTDAIALARHADGVLLVTRIGTTSRDKLRSAVATLRKVELRVVGLVAVGGGTDEDYYYAEKTPSTSRRKKGDSPRPEGAMPAPSALSAGSVTAVAAPDPNPPAAQVAPPVATSPLPTEDTAPRRGKTSVADLLESLREEHQEAGQDPRRDA